MKKGIKIFVIILVGIFLISLELFLFYNYVGVATLESIEIKDNMKNDDNMVMEISLEVPRYIISTDTWCAVSTNKNDEKNLDWIKANNNQCILDVEKDENIIYLKNKYGNTWQVASKDVELNKIKNLSFDKQEYFVPVDGDETFELAFTKYGVVDSAIKYKISDESKLKIEDSKFIGLAEGEVKVTATVSNKTVETTVYVMSSIVEPVINSKKEYLTCKQYTEEEAALLDKALKDRIDTAGYQTRAGAVAAARFLALEFKYRIYYFYENGRLVTNGERSYVDGEGRYYHKGLYLSESKFSSIKASQYGPAIWSCNLYSKIVKMTTPNGLDCSGYVSWLLLNAGFDVGDVGAGISVSRDNDLDDLGEKLKITEENLNSGKIKVGDLISTYGHIGILIGMENDTYYIAESLERDLHVLTLTKAELLKSDWLSFILMDEVYKEDGNLKNMW